MPASALFSLAQRACIRNVTSIHSIGDMPLPLADPILREIQQPKQLRKLEENSPQLVGETSELWLKFIKRDIPSQHNFDGEPEDPDEWHRLYEGLLAEHLEQEEIAEQWLRQQMSGIAAKRENNVATEMSTADMPSMERGWTLEDEKRREKKRLKRAYNRLPTQNLAQGARIKMKSGADVMRKVRIEARNMRAVNSSSMRTVATTGKEEIARRKAANGAAAAATAVPPPRRIVEIPRREQQDDVKPALTIAAPRIPPKLPVVDASNRNQLVARASKLSHNVAKQAPRETNSDRIAASGPSVSQEKSTSGAPSPPHKPPPLAPPPKIMKRKAPADPFLRVKKRA